MLTQDEREFAITELTLSLLDARAAHAVVDMMTPEQEEIVRDMIVKRIDKTMLEVLSGGVLSK